MSQRLSATQREVAEAVSRPASVGTTVIAGRIPSAGLIGAPGGSFMNRYDWAAQEDVVAGRYGRGKYGRARYREG